jgi:hypothetical protein
VFFIVSSYSYRWNKRDDQNVSRIKGEPKITGADSFTTSETVFWPSGSRGTRVRFSFCGLTGIFFIGSSFRSESIVAQPLTIRKMDCFNQIYREFQ